MFFVSTVHFGENVTVPAFMSAFTPTADIRPFVASRSSSIHPKTTTAPLPKSVTSGALRMTAGESGRTVGSRSRIEKSRKTTVPSRCRHSTTNFAPHVPRTIALRDDPSPGSMSVTAEQTDQVCTRMSGSRAVGSRFLTRIRRRIHTVRRAVERVVLGWRQGTVRDHDHLLVPIPVQVRNSRTRLHRSPGRKLPEQRFSCSCQRADRALRIREREVEQPVGIGVHQRRAVLVNVRLS